MCIATGRPVGPIVVINGSNDACHHVLFMVSLIRKNIFPYFLPKNVKNCITPCDPMGTLNSYNFGTVEDMYELFGPYGVFGVAQSNGVIQIYPRLTLVATATNRSYFNTKLAITRLK